MCCGAVEFMITTLIDKQDNVEVIRDQVAAILALEAASQVALATAAAKPDPSLWALRVYQERATPWENFPPHGSDKTPVINVWWETSSFEKSSSNVMERQKALATINIDCYGFGESKSDGGAGQIVGDQNAAENTQRAVRLARNILLASEYTYLGLRGVVWGRWVENITIFQPLQNNETVEHVVGARIRLNVEFNEFAPQYVAETLDLLSIDVKRAEDGLIVVEADYDYTI